MKKILLGIIFFALVTNSIVVSKDIDKKTEEKLKYIVLWQEKLMLRGGMELYVAGNKLVFLDEYKQLVCLSLADGAVAWTRQMDRSNYNFCRSIGGFLLLLQNNSIMRINLEDGRTLWEIKNIPIRGDRLLSYEKSCIAITTESQKSIFTRIDMETGKVLWRVEKPFYLWFEYDKTELDRYLILSGNSKIFILDVKQGSIIDEIPTTIFKVSHGRYLYKDEKLYFVTGYLPHETSLGFKFASFSTSAYWMKFNCYDLKTDTVTWSIDFDTDRFDGDRGSPKISFFGDYVKIFDVFVNIKTRLVVGELFTNPTEVAWKDDTEKYFSYKYDENQSRFLLYNRIGQQEPIWKIVTEKNFFEDFFGKKYIVLVCNETEKDYKISCHNTTSGEKLWSTVYPYAGSFVMENGMFIFLSYDPLAATQSLVCLDLSSGKVRWKIDESILPKKAVVSNGRIFFIKGKKLFCMEAENKKTLWFFDAKIDIASINAFSNSIVLLNNNGEVFGIKTQDGSVSWRKRLREKARENNIFIIEGKIYSYYVEKNNPQNTFHVYAIDPENGEEIEAYNYKGECFAFGRDFVFSDWFTKRQKHIVYKDYIFFGYSNDLIYVEIRLDNQEYKFACFNWKTNEKVWEKNDAKSFKVMTKEVVNGRFFLSSTDEILCCDAMTGKTLWKQKNHNDIESNHIAFVLDDKSNMYCMKTNSTIDYASEAFRTLQCIDGKTGNMSYEYLNLGRPESISAQNGIVMIIDTYYMTCLKDLNSAPPANDHTSLPYPYLFAVGLLIVAVTTIVIPICISRRRRKTKAVFTNSTIDDKN